MIPQACVRGTTRQSPCCALSARGARRGVTGPQPVVIERISVMKYTSLITTGIIICGLLVATLAFAALPSALPPEQTQGSVTYVSGGIVQEEAQAFEAAAALYPLTLEFAIKHTPRAEYTAN